MNADLIQSALKEILAEKQDHVAGSIAHQRMERAEAALRGMLPEVQEGKAQESAKEKAARMIAECHAEIAGLEAINLPAHDPTIAVEEMLSAYLPDDREDVWEAIKAYADIHARATVQLNAKDASPSPAMAQTVANERAMTDEVAAQIAYQHSIWTDGSITHVTKQQAGSFARAVLARAALCQAEADVEELIPDGWLLSTVDASLKAHGKSKTISVMLVKDKVGRDAYHALSDEGKESAALYWCAHGYTIRDAISLAAQSINAALAAKDKP
ncbi:hypothetical protein G5S34_17610 [Herbaspirillum frisingense]|uniref:hypothetical protein n=1 Tax=Herbaspirillum frisingense TaxID=92645 RepID=UPI0016036C4D|nr:hypothetical protein [Herbaspirillum frisingense]QNB08390.1 hypothetical protein G5S34_17610 [Herbaspirillum frisingense]